MSLTLLMIATLTAALMVSILRKNISKNSNGVHTCLIYNLIISATAIIILLFMGIGRASLFTLLLAMLFGLTIFSQQLSYIKALETGSFSYTTIITSLAMLIPSFSGAILWGEVLSWGKLAGVVFMIPTIILSVNRNKNTPPTSTEKGWLMWCGAAFLCGGLVGVIQKLHQKSPHKGESNEFLWFSFIFCFVYALAILLITKKRTKPQSHRLSGGVIIMMILAGAFYTANHCLNLYLSGKIDSIIFFPAVNGGGLLLTLLSAAIIFKERLTLRQCIGIGCGIISILLIFFF